MRPEAIRRRILEIRRQRPREEVARLSTQVIERFLAQVGTSASFWEGRKVALYRALPGELDLRTLEKWLLQVGSRLYFPRVVPREPGAVGPRQMEFVEVPREVLESPSAVGAESTIWRSGPYGIEEPHPVLRAVPPAELEMIFTPGVAFGLQGERVGMGAGYYDVFFPQAPEALRVALTFDDQLFSRIEQNAWDQPVHWVLTECREVLPEGDAARIRKRFFKR
jgi:5-formyltetrahydrofolate cyclo-ligase